MLVLFLALRHGEPSIAVFGFDDGDGDEQKNVDGIVVDDGSGSDEVLDKDSTSFSPLALLRNHFRFSFRGYPRGEVDGPFQHFFTICKYPPSLAYMLLTLGTCFVLLKVLSLRGPWNVIKNRVKPVLLTYGRAPLFFYFVHFSCLAVTQSMIHLIVGEKLTFNTLMPSVRRAKTSSLDSDSESDGIEQLGLLGGWHFTPGVFLGPWTLVVLGLYVPCKRYGAFKSRCSADSLWRML